MADNKMWSKPTAVILLAAAGGGTAAVALVPTAAAIVLLLFAFLAALLFTLIAWLVSRRVAYLKRNQYFGRLQGSGQFPVPMNRWLGLTAGLAIISTLVGVGATWRVVSNALTPEPAVAFETPAPRPVATAEPVPSAPPSPSLSPTPSPEPSAAADPSASPEPAVTPGTGNIAYLDSMDRINGWSSSGPAYLSAKRYPRSINMECGRATSEYNEWNVAGRHSFSATLGIDDNAQNVFGALAEFIFYDQDGHQLGKNYTVSVGHPQAITLDLTSIVRLRITCSGRDSKTNSQRYFRATLGDAYVQS